MMITADYTNERRQQNAQITQFTVSNLRVLKFCLSPIYFSLND